jgi:hypothetical protein
LVTWRLLVSCLRACSLTKSFDDESEVEEGKDEHIELLKSGEDSPEALEASEEPLDLVALLVEGTVLVPGLDTIALGTGVGDSGHPCPESSESSSRSGSVRGAGEDANRQTTLSDL